MDIDNKLKNTLQYEYAKMANKTKTTFIDLLVLLITSNIDFKYFIKFIKSHPITINILVEEDSILVEEVLSTNFGLKLVAKDIFLTWDGYLIEYEKGKNNYVKTIKI